MAENEPKAQEVAPTKKAQPAKTVRLACVYPYETFDPGDGLDVVTADGTEYTREDASKVQDRAYVLGLKQGYPVQISEVE